MVNLSVIFFVLLAHLVGSTSGGIEDDVGCSMECEHGHHDGGEPCVVSDGALERNLENPQERRSPRHWNPQKCERNQRRPGNVVRRFPKLGYRPEEFPGFFSQWLSILQKIPS